MLFDTLQLSKDLQESFSPQQAETLARVLAHAGDEQLATKADLLALNSDVALLKTDVATLKTDVAALKTDVSALRGDFATFRAEVSAGVSALEARFVKELSLFRADSLRWIVTAIGFNFFATAGLIVALVKVFGR